MKTQQPLPDETRQAASKALVKLADAMMLGAQSLMRNYVRVLNPDAKVHGQVLSDLRRYQGFHQPCSDEVVHIEALLAGMPADQCITKAEKRRRARQEEKRRWQEGQPQRREALAAAIVKGITEKTETKERRVDGNVIEGPWPDAS